MKLPKKGKQNCQFENIFNNAYLMLMANLQETLNVCSVHSIMLTKDKYSDSNIALCLACGWTAGGHKVTVRMLKNPDSLKTLMCTEQAYKFLKKCLRISGILAARMVWCFGNVESARCSYLVSISVCSRFTLAWNDSSCCNTTRYEVSKETGVEYENRTIIRVPESESCYSSWNVSA